MRHPISVLVACVAVGASLIHCGSDEAPAERACELDCADGASSTSNPDASAAEGKDGASDPSVEDASSTDASSSDASDASTASGVDPSFGNGGVVLTALRDGSDMLIDVAKQSDGKLVAVGTNWAHADAFVVRFNVDGTPDTSFGVGGSTIIRLALEGKAVAVALQPDGKIVVLCTEVPSSSVRSVVVRLDATGAIDPTWGTGGRALFGATAGALAVQSDGKVLVAVGSADVTRLTSSGATDTSFGSSGTTVVPWGNISSAPFAFGIDGDGRITVASAVYKHIGIARLTAAGILDAAFDGDGVLDTAVEPDVRYGHPLAVQSDGKVVVGGYLSGSNSHVIARYDTAGVLDTSFDTDGYTAIGSEGYIEDIELDTTGAETKLVVLRGGDDSSGEAMYRYALGGAPDGTFGNAGRAPLSQPAFSRSHAFAVVAGGKYVLAGEQRNKPPAYQDSIFLPRLLAVAASGPIDTSWATNGRAWVHSHASSDEVHIVVPTSAGGVLAVGRSSFSGFAGSGFSLAKYTSAGVLDTAFGTQGITHYDTTVGAAEPRAVSFDSAGRILVAGGEGAPIVRFTSAGALDGSFGSGGAITGGPQFTYALAVDGSDRLVVGGTANSPQGYMSVLTRLTSTGDSDKTFGTNGSVLSAGGSNAILALALRSDGKILVTGAGSPGFLARYDVDGGPDGTFQSTSGAVGVGYALDLAPDGKVVVAGASTVGPYMYALDTYYRAAKLVVGRFLENGTPDSSFAQGGVLSTNLAGTAISSPVAYAVRTATTGYVYVAGTGTTLAGQRGFVLRLLPNGTIDTSFGDQGVLVLASSEESALFTLALQPNGSPVAGGYSYVNPSGRDFALMRLLP